MNKQEKERFDKTLKFIKRNVGDNVSILDLGTKNPLSNHLISEGYNVTNTNGENLDDEYLRYTNVDVELITAFEIFEHMLAPYNFLKNVKKGKLIASVPLKLWFADAYWHEDDDWSNHYHEFEKKQFDFLLKQTGWTIKASESWPSSNLKRIGIRPILRYFVHRYYIVYCEK
jgi:hypothetical protein